MSKVIKILGVVAILVGIVMFFVADDASHREFGPLISSMFISAGVSSIVSGILIFGFGHLIAVNEKTSDGISELLKFAKLQNASAATSAKIDASMSPSTTSKISDYPIYDHDHDAQPVKKWKYRGHEVITLSSNEVAVKLAGGWRRFASIDEFDAAYNR